MLNIILIILSASLGQILPTVFVGLLIVAGIASIIHYSKKKMAKERNFAVGLTILFIVGLFLIWLIK